MQFFVGTSGYSYKEWKGTFYPAKLPAKDMLPFYAQHFSTVEINNTFYRMPKIEVVEAWGAQVPDDFRFILKAPQTITHRKRLKDVDESVAMFIRAASALKKKLGPLLFQLPPNMKKDLPRLEGLLALLSDGTRAALEFRHESWFDDDVYDALRAHSCALCVADADDLPAVDLVKTADWGYLRLRRENYTLAGLSQWLERVRGQGWAEAHIVFKHEDAGVGPAFAKQLLELIDAP
jgi:uncharacterized protein YecE (DUF72 family)